MAVPKVSIAVPSYNHGRFLRQWMDSIPRQTYQDFEVFVLDDASTDNTREVLAEYANRPRVEPILRQQCLGNVIRDLEDLRVCAYLLSRLPVSNNVPHEVCDRISRRWVRHAIRRPWPGKSLTYNLQVLHLLRQLDPWYGATIIKHLARGVLRKSFGK